MVKVSAYKKEKISEYMMDLSKLLVGSSFIPVFAPGFSGKNFDLFTFSIGMLLAVICLFFGIKFLPGKNQ